MECLPESLAGTVYFEAQDAGEETAIKQRLEEIKRRRKKR